jgi:propionyl-CoA synthetase
VSFKDVYEGWKSNPEGFWMKAAESIDWIKPPSKALWDDDAPFYEWFKDAKVNTPAIMLWIDMSYPGVGTK